MEQGAEATVVDKLVTQMVDAFEKNLQGGGDHPGTAGGGTSTGGGAGAGGSVGTGGTGSAGTGGTGTGKTGAGGASPPAGHTTHRSTRSGK